MEEHPDQMSDFEEFRVLLEERPEIAEFELKRGLAALDLIEHLWSINQRSVEIWTQSTMLCPVGQHAPGDPQQLAVNYGVLWQQHVLLTTAMNEMIGTMAPGMCGCGSFHGNVPHPEDDGHSHGDPT